MMNKQAGGVQRIGIFAGTFDPVHKGHVAFALNAAESAELDKVYFLPETRPRGKAEVTHVSHRIAMLKLAVRAHRKLEVLDLPDKQFHMARTWPRIKQRFAGDKLVLLMGSDVFSHLPTWPHVAKLFDDAGIIVSTRGQRDVALTLDQVVGLNKTLLEVHLVE